MKLKKSAAKTLSFFDCFDHPLTLNELHQQLWNHKIDYDELLDQEENLREFFDNKDSYFCLNDRKEIINKRQERVKISKKKLDIAKKAAKKLRWIPFLRSVFICNTLALGSVDEESDIDFFIVAEENRVWLVRFFANIILKLFGLRVNGNKKSDKICLSFFTSENSLGLSEVTIDRPDVYLIYWINQLLPLYDPYNFYQKIQRKNQWIQDYLPNIKIEKRTTGRLKVEDSKLSKLWKKIMETVWSGGYGNQIDTQTKKIQEMKLKGFFGNDYKSDGKNVILKKNIIKLHKNDRRKEYKNKWKQNYKNYLND